MSSTNTSARATGLIRRVRSQHLPDVDLDGVPLLDEPLRILNISGLGRSGSTLLGQLLGEHPSFTYVGEIHKIWSRSYGENALCSCRRSFHDCPFWSEVDTTAFSGLPPATATGLAKLERHVLRKRLIPDLLKEGWPGDRGDEVARRVLAYRTRLYEAIRMVSGTPWILDAGKDPVYGLLLSHLRDVELHVVHVVRDPRAVAHSWLRRLTSDDLAETFPVVSPGATASQWMQVNLVSDLILGRRARSKTTVRYEDLVDRPNEVLEEVLVPLGLGAGFRPVVDGEATLERRSHFIAGNPGRRTGGAVVRLRLDDEWERTMSESDKRTVSRRCWPLMGRYGYR